MSYEWVSQATSQLLHYSLVIVAGFFAGLMLVLFFGLLIECCSKEIAGPASYKAEKPVSYYRVQYTVEGRTGVYTQFISALASKHVERVEAEFCQSCIYQSISVAAIYVACDEAGKKLVLSPTAPVPVGSKWVPTWERVLGGGSLVTEVERHESKERGSGDTQA